MRTRLFQNTRPSAPHSCRDTGCRSFPPKAPQRHKGKEPRTEFCTQAPRGAQHHAPGAQVRLSPTPSPPPPTYTHTHTLLTFASLQSAGSALRQPAAVPSQPSPAPGSAAAWPDPLCLVSGAAGGVGSGSPPVQPGPQTPAPSRRRRLRAPATERALERGWLRRLHWPCGARPLGTFPPAPLPGYVTAAFAPPAGSRRRTGVSRTKTPGVGVVGRGKNSQAPGGAGR